MTHYQAFLERHPKSSFLAVVLEVAAKTSMDLGDINAALRYGRESLLLLPENPLLLVPLAEVELQQGETAEAVRKARLALGYLDRFSRPSAFSEKDWARVEEKLCASSYFILGRAAAGDALKASAGARDGKLREAEDSFLQSMRLSHDDPSAAYFLGPKRMAQAKVHDAAMAIAVACRRDSPYRAEAERRLREIYHLDPSRSPQGFEAFLANLASQAAGAPTRVRAGEIRPRAAHGSPVSYAGSPACQRCHPRRSRGVGPGIGRDAALPLRVAACTRCAGKRIGTTEHPWVVGE